MNKKPANHAYKNVMTSEIQEIIDWIFHYQEELDTDFETARDYFKLLITKNVLVKV